MKGMKIPGRILCVLLMLMLLPSAALADLLIPYETYNYDHWGNLLYTPAAYVPRGTVLGTSLQWQGESIGAFKNPQDFCVAPNGDVYLADTGNNRIIVMDSRLTEVRNVIDSFQNGDKADKFKQPSGVAVSQKNQIYIADSMNRRIVVLDEDGTLLKIVENPQSRVLAENFTFTPLRVAVDYADRIYVIAQKMFEGIMVFEANGEFTGFFGTIEVKITAWEKFWRALSTKEERSKQQLFIPTEFTGIDIDDKGFVYASNVDSEGKQAVRRLNPKGEDVILKGTRDNLGGDLWTDAMGSYAGPSRIVDVIYRGRGIYSLLDSKRGRIFTYDQEGNLLYIFGGLGTQSGTFTNPVAIEYANDQIMVLDSMRNAIMLFGETEYGSLINDAVGLRFDGAEAEAVPLWERVLKLDEDNELANSGIGKAYLAAGDHEQAIKYLQLGMNRDFYSIAFKRYRNDWFEQNTAPLLTAAVVAIIGGYFIVKGLKRHGKLRKKDD